MRNDSTFCIHSDCDVVEPTALDDVRIPAATASWRPIGHGQVRDGMIQAIGNAGLAVKRERWALSQLSKKARQPGYVPTNPRDGVLVQDGNRCFGLIELHDPTANRAGDAGGWSMAIGIQNSLDMSMALRRVVGASVFVCDNMVFSTHDADGVVTFRKHTSMIDLAAECFKTVASAQRGFDPFAAFIGRLQDTSCDNQQFNEIVCRSIRAGIVPGTGANDMLAGWYDREAERPDLHRRLRDGFYDDRTAWTAHGLWTDAVAKRINPTAGNRIIDAQAQYNEIIGGVLSLN